MRSRLGRVLAALAVVGLVLALAFGVRWGDSTLYPPAPEDEAVAVYVVSNGFHSGIVLPVAELADVAGREGDGALKAVATRFADFDRVEIGWGEERFYQVTPTIASISWRLGLRALFWPGNKGILHVAGIEDDLRTFFGRADLVRVRLSRPGFARLLARLETSFARDPAGLPVAMGTGLYGPSLFYRANGTFSFANLCNHWTERMLDAAGVPVTPLLATVPRGVVLDLAWRSGLSPEP